jgi:hypothetical protein
MRLETRVREVRTRCSQHCSTRRFCALAACYFLAASGLALEPLVSAASPQGDVAAALAALAGIFALRALRSANVGTIPRW